MLIRTDSKVAMSWCSGKQFLKEKPRRDKPEAYALHLEYVEAAKPHKITFEWVKGHAGDVDNERADVLAEGAARTPGAAPVVVPPAVDPVPAVAQVAVAAPAVKAPLPASSSSKIRLTHENLHELGSGKLHGGFTRKQIELLGFSWPAPGGWLKSLIGTEIERELYERVRMATTAKRLQEISQQRLL